MIVFTGYRVYSAQSLLKLGTCIKTTATITRNNSNIAATTKREKWDLMSAVSLERKPIITRNLTPVEEEVFNILNTIEFEKSSKSDHEIQLITDRIKLQELKKGRGIDLDNIPEKSAQDFEDSSQEELKNFKFANRETNADRSNNVKSIDRHLDRSLLLLVKEKIGKNSYWVLPQGKRQDGETLRQTAERILVEKCGPEIKADFFGNAPVGFYKYKYPLKVRKDENASVGAKIFFFKAQLKDGTVKVNSNFLEDYQWATQKELSILSRDYYKSVSMFIIDEDH